MSPTADALHCNRRTVAEVNVGSGDWCLALKANRESLRCDARAPEKSYAIVLGVDGEWAAR